MGTDNSKEIFERFYNLVGHRTIRVRLKNGKSFEGRFIGFFRGDTERNEPFIFRWHFLGTSDPVFDYDKTIDPDHGFYIEQSSIQSVEFC